MRMFGRGLDEKKRKKKIRKLGGGGRKVKGDGTVAAAKVKSCFLFMYTYFRFSEWYRIDPSKNSWVPSLSH
jgi:hypothetical protein